MRLPAALVVLCLVPAAFYVQESAGAHAAKTAPQDRTSVALPDEVVDGVILPFLTVELNVPTDGVLSEVAYERGQTVQAGALLARLDSSVERESAELARLRSEFQSARRIAEVKLEAARAKLEKRQSLLSDGIVTAEEVEESLAEVALAELELLSFRVTLLHPSAEAGKATNVYRLEAVLLLGPSDAPWARPGMEGVGRIEVGQRSPAWLALHRVVDRMRMLSWR